MLDPFGLAQEDNWRGIDGGALNHGTALARDHRSRRRRHRADFLDVLEREKIDAIGPDSLESAGFRPQVDGGLTWWRHPEILADLAGHRILDLSMPGDRRPLVQPWVSPPRMAGTLSQKLASIPDEMCVIRSRHSCRDLHQLFHVSRLGGTPSVFPVEYDGLFERDPESLEKGFLGRLLAIDAWNLLDPADPVVSVLLDDRRVRVQPGLFFRPLVCLGNRSSVSDSAIEPSEGRAVMHPVAL